MYHKLVGQPWLPSLLSDQSHHDMMMVTESLSLPCHRLVLAAAGGPATAGLLLQTRDTALHEVVVVKCNGYSGATVTAVRDVLYGLEVMTNGEEMKEVKRLLIDIVLDPTVVDRFLGIRPQCFRNENAQQDPTMLRSTEVMENGSFLSGCDVIDVCVDINSATSKNTNKKSQGKDCSQCGKGFTRITHLNRHLKAVHSEKNLKCSLCDYR